MNIVGRFAQPFDGQTQKPRYAAPPVKAAMAPPRHPYASAARRGTKRLQTTVTSWGGSETPNVKMVPAVPASPRASERIARSIERRPSGIFDAPVYRFPG